MIRGHSGCNIEFTDGIVIKSSPNYPSKRLEAQAAKQRRFARKKYINICVPQIYDQYYIEDVFHFEMEYFNAIDMIKFFDTKNLELIQDWWEAVTEFLTDNFHQSHTQKIDRQILIDKYNTVRIDDRFDDLFYNDEPLYIPIGQCHGDLTLSNMLYCNGKFVLIDFLDSFIESPLIDVAKLKQDTRFYWSLLLYNQPFNLCRLMSIFHMFTCKLDYYYSWQEIKLLEILNLLRIIPYCKDPFIEQEVRNMLCQF